MMNKQHTLVGLATVLGMVAAMSAAHAFDGQQYVKQARITLEQARTIALGVAPGATIGDEELEREHGGSGLRYSFDLRTPQGEREVGVDAMSGKVLEHGADAGNKD